MARSSIGATVTLLNGLTGYRQTVKSDASGYQFLAVPIGAGYEVTVESAGFEKAIQNGITLLVNQDFRADFKLVVGAASQTVTASAVTMQVESTSTQLGDVIQDTKMQQMPLNGRSFTILWVFRPAWFRWYPQQPSIPGTWCLSRVTNMVACTQSMASAKRATHSV